MKHSTFNYVRTCRLRHALTAQELARLVGQSSDTAISKIENGERVPTLELALALQIVFGQSPRAVFPEFYEHVEESVMRRARDLYDEVEDASDGRSVAKRELLEAMAARREDREGNVIQA